MGTLNNPFSVGRLMHGCFLRIRSEQQASEIASQAKTADDLNGLMRLMVNSALERMLDTEMDVHLGRKAPTVDTEGTSAETPTTTESAPENRHVSGTRTNDTKHGRKEKSEVLLPFPLSGLRLQTWKSCGGH